MPSLATVSDLVTSKSALQNYWSVPHLFCGRTPYRIAPGGEKWLGLSWKGRLKFQNLSQVKAVIVQKGCGSPVEAVDTVDESFHMQSNESNSCASVLLDESSSKSLSPSRENEPETEIADFEKLRRLRISRSNKGKIPWNKGRKHSPETIKRIRERTWKAMQDPKVRKKLSKLGYNQSVETRQKIASGMKGYWERLREKKVVQGTIRFEWQHAIAEASRKGYSVEEELQWHSYEQWKELVVIIEKGKTTDEPRIIRRGEKSPEHRRKISEAIAAKWADPEYYERVRLGMAKGKSSAGNREGSRRNKQKARVKSISEFVPSKIEVPVMEKKIAPRKKISPTYKDPMAGTKLKMIKKIRQQRLAMENRKRKATENAKSLITEAKKALEALEEHGSMSPLIQASVLESKGLIAEAMRYIEISEKGEKISEKSETSTQGGRNSNAANGADSDVPYEQSCSNSMPQDPHEPLVNGYNQQPITDLLERSFHFKGSTSLVAPNGLASSSAVGKPEDAGVNGQPSSQLTAANGCISEQQDKMASANRDGDSGTQEDAGVQAQQLGSSAPRGKTKRWIRGRLVEVELGG